MLIINSDDFGNNLEKNKAIITTFQKGLCSSTTILPNMPGFEEAVEYAHEHNLLNKVGIHSELVEGQSLTDKIKKCPLFCDDNGHFHFQEKRILKLSSCEKEAVFTEICAQIDLCRRKGLPLTHLDSNYHIHHSWGLLGVILKIVKEKKIPFIRLRGLASNTTIAKRASTFLYNTILKISGVAGTEYFADIRDFLQLKRKLNSGKSDHFFEIMIHPVFDTNGELIDGVHKQSLEKMVTQIDGYKSAISYGQIKHL